MKGIYNVVCAVALVFAASSAVAAPEGNSAPLRIAQIDPLSGDMGLVGQPVLAELKFDAARINKAGGIDGHRVEIKGFDNQLSPQETLVQFQKAVHEGYRYVTQAASDSVASALMNAVKHHNQRDPQDPVVYLNWGSQDPAFTNARCSFWNFFFDDNQEMKMNLLTDWIAKQKTIHKVFLLNEDYGFGERVSREAVQMLTKKRPDIKIVGNVFHPLAKVHDFTPYVTQIKASGADAVVTGDWGNDMALLVKTAAGMGLSIPFITYYGETPGTVQAVGKKGVGRLYAIAEIGGDYSTPALAMHNAELYKKTGWNFVFLRVDDMMHMLAMAGNTAHSIAPVQVAYALEGMQYQSPTGLVTMRRADHQIQLPMFITVLHDHMSHGLKDTDLNFHIIAKFPASQGALPTTCHMQRPQR